MSKIVSGSIEKILLVISINPSYGLNFIETMIFSIIIEIIGIDYINKRFFIIYNKTCIILTNAFIKTI